MTPIVGFAPDAELTTPGVLADCVNLVPTLTGMEGGPTAVTPAGVPVLPAACQGAAVVTKLDNTRRVIAGAQAAIYELVAGAWVNQTRAVGGAYTGGTESIWSITQFGDATLMANKADTIQRSTTGAFANIATAPKAEIVFSVGAFVMALSTNDGVEKADGWHCCAAFDDSSWTPNITTQAASGRLVATPGPLTAGARLGEYAIAYKAKSIYLGQYVGAPVVWDWTQVRGGNAGCVGKNALCDVDGTHFFVGEDNFWLFDGSSPVPIADGVLRDFFTADCNPAFKYKIVCSYDRPTNRVLIFYPSSNVSTLDSCLVYHVKSKKWGRANRTIQCAIEYVSAGATYDTLTTFSATIDGLPEAGWDSQFWLSGGRAFSIFNTSNQLQSLTGASDASSFETGDVGDDDAVLLLQGIRLRYKTAPTSATVQTRHKKNSGLSYENGPSGVLADGKFDVLITNRWHRAVVSFVGPVHATHIKAMSKVVGKR